MRTSSVLMMILLLAGGGSTASNAADDGKRTLNGLYTSGFTNGPQRLRAEFTPAEDGTWTVDMHFRWEGRDRVYTGVAEGSLSEGLLHGRVRNEDRTRIFTFRCEFDKKKRCKGKHSEVVRTGESETGTITLKE